MAQRSFVPTDPGRPLASPSARRPRHDPRVLVLDADVVRGRRFASRLFLTHVAPLHATPDASSVARASAADPQLVVRVLQTGDDPSDEAVRRHRRLARAEILRLDAALLEHPAAALTTQRAARRAAEPELETRRSLEALGAREVADVCSARLGLFRLLRLLSELDGAWRVLAGAGSPGASLTIEGDRVHVLASNAEPVARVLAADQRVRVARASAACVGPREPLASFLARVERWTA